ncbi:hypothetical protein Sp245p_28850 (plasmid) [Azospirillum baldaniorum]|uniref:Uncharacterized protein n=1 Tax=Azospirillum baldaniorum TaxID=1064539 RepID=A0A9P1JY65_9PROT|nr:hypothetical protein [Azospirillum baldaniorum]AWJ93831.1 hypothetical protein Sp245p_28850 [Azospirillum baldaniorum]TWA81654.1 hypothetical protein FBZ85_10228 [Azospirillum brasilense]CCD01989.1 protein of unknown function [Azospirillum baldaniorum]
MTAAYRSTPTDAARKVLDGSTDPDAHVTLDKMSRSARGRKEMVRAFVEEFRRRNFDSADAAPAS